MKKNILALAVAAVAIMAVGASAASASFGSAKAERYQLQSMTITAVQPLGVVGQFSNVWTHTYDVVLNPCDGSFSGTGSVSSVSDGVYSTETITGRLAGSKISFTAKRSTDGLEYTLSNAPLGMSTVTLATSNPAAPWALEFKVGATTPIATTSYKSHGEYVSSVGGGADAAHSCIGMAKKGPADSVLGSIVYSNDSFGLASFSFAAQDGGESANDRGTAFYADKSGYYYATATDVAIDGPTSATISLRVTSSKHPSVPVGTEFTVTVHDEPGTRDYFTINNQANKQFVAKAGNIEVNYR